MTVVFNRPYEFVPPDKSGVWPWLIQRLRLVDRYLKKKEGVAQYECRHLQRVQLCLDRGDGILWAPNHCRYADPLALGWPARELGINVHAMASWHLFNEGAFDSFAIRKMGGFSIYREGTDRKSLDTAIETLVEAKRPLILFPEGTTNRTNDELKPLLDGVSFIARTAARRRAKNDGNVVLMPVGIKYLCLDDIRPWAEEQLSGLEKSLGWTRPSRLSIRERTLKLAEAMLSLKEVQYFGRSVEGKLPERRDALIEHLLATWEATLGVPADYDQSVRGRVRAIRSLAASRHFDQERPRGPDGWEPDADLADAVAAADLAQELSSYPDSYLVAEEATDTRLVETIQRMQESIYGKSDASMRLKAVIEFSEAIPVPAERAPRGVEDPLMAQLRTELESMLTRLSTEANKLCV